MNSDARKEKERARQREVKRRERQDPERRKILAARHKKWREANPEHVKAKHKAWRETHPEHGKERYADEKYQAYCSRKSREWRARNPGKMAEYAFNHRLRKRGITRADFDRMMTAQNGRCAVCGDLPIERSGHERLNIDHCHKTNRVRGLLCTPCNLTLGYVNDDPSRLTKLIEYLAQHR